MLEELPGWGFLYILMMNSKFECNLFLGGGLLKSTYKVVIKLIPRNDIFEIIKLLMKMSIRRPKCEIVHIFNLTNL